MQCGLYKHYKGDLYQVLGVAAHSETEELMVVYVSLDATRSGPRMRVRPFSMFTGNVGPTEARFPRFQYVGQYLDKEGNGVF